MPNSVKRFLASKHLELTQFDFVIIVVIVAGKYIEPADQTSAEQCDFRSIVGGIHLTVNPIEDIG